MKQKEILFLIGLEIAIELISIRPARSLCTDDSYISSYFFLICIAYSFDSLKVDENR